ncbi:malonic semialdehyde reductase [Actinotalea sp. BY-33]|uniref:Malonic semialdehyde reductase n=1 Tax=Actinotalea soli TaxID=2819234 RepID=A0A939LTW9_9CELL|nr:malonic semialdehyde reductase [Actinotalea soli]MBO1752930.1 malonic semialdehyde reductase [Actinotalea soli]
MSIDTSQSAVVSDEVLDLVFREARTVNTFSDEDVSDEQVREVWELVRWGPTAFNSLPMRMLLVRSTEARERLASHMSGSNAAKTLRAPLSIVLAADLDFHEHLPRLAPHLAALRDQLADAPDSRTATSRDNTFLQAGYLVVGLRAAGLHVGPMTGFDAPGVDADLFAGSPWRSIMVLNVGAAPADHEGFSTPATRDRQARLDFEDVARVV